MVQRCHTENKCVALANGVMHLGEHKCEVLIVVGKSALADYHHHPKCMLTKVQHPMRRDDTHPAYKALRQLSKPKCQPGRQMKHGISDRQLQLLFRSVLFNGFGMSLSCSQLLHPMLLSC